MARVELDGISKRFGSNGVLTDISLDIRSGEFLVLVGPSGCGKSTLLRVLAGLEEADAGAVRINGREVNGLEPRDRDVAMVFQSYALYPHMSVRDNIGFSLKLSGQPKAEIDAAVDEAARLLGLTELLGRKPRALSGGQRQRVAMGRAIVRRPALFLFDEPLSNLDAKLRVQMRTEVRALHDRLDATSVYVTHDQVEAMTMADRVVVLDAGRIIQIGTPLELYQRPVNRFVAEFIGAPSINILPGEVAADGTLRLGAVGLGRADAPPGPVDIGIRPEDLAPAADGEEALPLTAEIVEHLGAETYVFGEVAGRQVCWRRPGAEGRPGETHRLRPVPGRIHLFDRASGRSLALVSASPTDG